MRWIAHAVLLGLMLCAGRLAWADETVALASLDLAKASQDWGKPGIDQSVEGRALKIAGTTYARGWGAHADADLLIDLKGAGRRFSGLVGVDDEVLPNNCQVSFVVMADDKPLYEGRPIKAGDTAQKIDVDLTGVKTLELRVETTGDSINFCHADWADAVITYAGPKPEAVEAVTPPEDAIVLTPPSPPEPRVNGPKVLGVHPGSPVLYKIPATGERPMVYSVDNLPAGLAVEGQTGIITGSLPEKGAHLMRLRARNAHGESTRPFKLIVGDTLALTPPLGWNSWNCFAGAVNEAKVKSAATAMVSSGLSDHGWTYINIDDTWEIKPGSNDPKLAGDARDAAGMINSNRKFPDMKRLCAEIHAMGLKAGIYSSPGAITCAGFTASYQHEEQDARRWADWGFDYLKYDWCSYQQIAPHPDLAAFQQPYRVMRAALDKVPRDIVFSFCQYGMGNVWEWGASAGGNCWRTTGDITDTWQSMSHIGFRQDGHEKYAGPGHWNDPDMLVVGSVGWGRLHPSRLTPNEQYTHITLWSLLSAPLLIGCDMTAMDDFTKGLLTNDEVLAVNQDTLGKPAGRILRVGQTEVWARDLEDGGKAVGLFNRGSSSQTVGVKWPDLGLAGKQTVRDLWRQQDVGVFNDGYATPVPRHGAALIKISPVGQ